MNRRQFLVLTTAAASLPALGQAQPKPSRLPVWRGVNLLEKFNPSQNRPYQERHFRWLRDWGFNFVRLPMSYQCWSKPDPAVWMQMDEQVLREIDQAVAWGKKYNIHVNLNLHRLPGYCVNPPAEPLNLWKDEQAQTAAIHHWKTLARRYRKLSNKDVSFDLINEPPNIPEEDYAHVIRMLVKGIREVTPKRLIIADGIRWGTGPVHSIANLNVGQSTRGYNPMQVSHYHANWVNGSDKYPTPQWPMAIGETQWDKDLLRERYIKPWKELEAKGVGIHVGEWGAYNRTPHDVALKWMEDNLQLWKEAGWGWALWNLDGSFGFINSGRTDVAYETFEGEKLDRKMLELLQRY
ncbi:glycoside hydrolase family 5 protein [Telluribacter humicola]|uniref:glycoside hydrolase family 5 protein n=1 Tax=Telluribacter humicola TaxID=1720261 RepID=UPI001A97CE3C|nr:cellulase family glycosylhydrolase [Telluribacter humicola]